MGDFLAEFESPEFEALCDIEDGGLDEDGKPVMSSCSSVTTRPLAVISLLRIIRL